MKKYIFLTSVLLSLFLIFVYARKWNQAQLVWTAAGENTGDSFGAKVAGAGDVNGDGYADVAVWASDFLHSSGKMYVFYGSSHGLSQKSSWARQGENPGDEYGHSFGTTGDVNGDKVGDFIVAAQGYGIPESPGIGKAYLYLGSKGGLSLNPDWTHLGGASEELFGDCSGRAGDINQDGFSDVIIGAYGFDHFRGAAYLFLGAPNGGLSEKPVWRGEGKTPGDWFGYSVSTAGDVNHDGFTDIIIGAKQTPKKNLKHVGAAYAYYGSKDGLPKNPSWKAAGENTQDLFGWRAITAGDVNGDGFSDTIVSAYTHGEPAGSSCGKVYVYLGSAKGLAAKPGWTKIGEMSGALFGMTIGSGDFNQDGFADILVGSPNVRPGGKIYLFLGSSQGLSSTPSWTKEGEKEGDNFGTYLANAGDVNGDGYPDVMVGSPQAFNPEKKNRPGKAYLFYGGKDGKLGTLPR